MTTYYVRSDAAGGGDGTTNTSGGANGAWTLSEALNASSPAYGGSGTLIIVADAAYTGIDYTLVPSTSGCLITGANASGVIDGTRPTLQWVSSGGTYVSSWGMYTLGRTLVQNINFDANGNTSVHELFRGNTGVSLVNCNLLNADRGTNNNGNNRNVKAENCTSTGIQCVHGSVTDCLTKDCGEGYRVGRGTFVKGCVDIDAVDEAFQNFLGSPAIYENCIAYRSSLGGNVAFDCESQSSYSGCVAVNWAIGFDVSNANADEAAYLTDCYAYNCTTPISGTPSPAGDSSVTTTDPGLADPTGATPDFGTAARLDEVISTLPFEINGRTAEYAGLTQVLASAGGGSNFTGILI